MARTEDIVVQVSDRILWVGRSAYPLQNIARVQTVRLVPDRAAATRSWLMWTAFWVCLGAAALVGLNIARSYGLYVEKYVSYDDMSAKQIVIGVVFVLVLLGTIRLIMRVMRRTYYALVIETAGNPQALVVSPDGNRIENTVRNIVQAINDPRVSFRTVIQNHHFGDVVHGDKFGGDQINVSGSHNIGKR